MNNPELRLREYYIQYKALMEAREAFLNNRKDNELWTTVSSYTHSALDAMIKYWDCYRKTYEIDGESNLILAHKFPNNQLKHNNDIAYTSTFLQGAAMPLAFPYVSLAPDVYWAPIGRPKQLNHPDQYELYLKMLVNVPVHTSLEYAIKMINEMNHSG